MRRPIDNARQVTGQEPVSLLESWNEKNLQVAVWRLATPLTLKFATVNHYACFAITAVDNQVLHDEQGRQLRTGPIEKGRFRLVQGPTVFDGQLTSRAPVEMLNIYFSNRLLHQIAGDLGHRSNEIVMRDPLWEEKDELVETLAFSIVEDMRSEATTDRLFAQESALLILQRMLVRHSSLNEARHGSETRPQRDFRWAIEFMADNIDKPVSVDQLAALADMPTFGFIRSFNKIHGTTPMRYLRQMRLERAKDMLIHTSLPIAAISHRLGFSDSAHFVVAFKRAEGMTPRAYRLASIKSSKRSAS
jgi:AraC-like DNA-binding protein